MALLRNLHTGRHVMLRPLHTFGRHPSACQTVMRCPIVSQVHALVRWTLQRWEIFDQSRNGTFVNGVRLPFGTWRALEPGSGIALGDSPEAHWSVVDLAPPLNCLLPLRGPVIALKLRPQGLLLPSEAQPEVHICCREGRWMLEDPHGATVLEDGAAIRTSAMDWEAVLCPDLMCTQQLQYRQAPPPGADLLLHFELSQDEEHAHLRVETGGDVVDLGERIHHYLLATLARQCQADEHRGLSGSNQGWVTVEALARMLGVDASHVNIQIFRARQQLANALPAHSPATLGLVVERRRGEVRMGECSFTIRRGHTLEGGMRRHGSSVPKEERDTSSPEACQPMSM